MSVSTPFPSRYNGKCKSLACSRGGVISKRQMIRWDSERKGVVWHDGCPTPPSTVGVDLANRFDNPDVADSATSRGQGPMFDAVADEQPIVTPPVFARSAPAPVIPGNHDFLGGLADALAPYLDAKLKGLVDEDMVLGLIQTALDGAILKTCTTVTVVDVAGESRDMGLQHCQFPQLLKYCSARTRDGHRLNIWLTGPAGSGKTTAARNVAEALGLPFVAYGAQDNPYGLLGFIDAQGQYRRTPLRDIFEHGGVALLDETDAYTNSACIALNSATSNGYALFPDGMVKRHKDCVIIAAANTWGLGATSDFVGRLKLDAAFLDRFVFIAWKLDEGMESALNANNTAWMERVQGLRKNAATKGIKSIISPRACDYGAALLAVGVDIADVEASTVKKAMSADQWGAIA